MTKQITVQSHFNDIFGVHRNGPFISERVIKGQFYKGIIGKWPFHGHFPIIPL